MFKREEIPFVLGKHDGWCDRAVACPVCGEENNHPMGAAVTNGADDYEATSCWTLNGKSANFIDEPIKSVNRGRGNDVLILFDCEHGHRWARRYLFHKGTTYVSDVVLESLEVLE